MRTLLLLIVLNSTVNFVSAQSLAINTDGSAAAASAMLDVKNPNKGLLMPRTSTTTRTAIASPAKGLTMYDTTTSSYWYHNGAAWAEMSQGSGTAWGINGNGATNPATNYIGTTNAQPLVFRTAGTERARITGTGALVVNSTIPFAADILSAYATGGGYAVNGYAAGSGVAGYFNNSGTGTSVEGSQNGTDGSAGQFSISGFTTNPSPVVDVYNQTGSAPALMIRTSLANATADGIELDIEGAAAKRGIDMYLDAATTGIGISVFHQGTQRCLSMQQQNTTNTQSALFASVAGNARVINAQSTLTTHTSQIGYFSQGSTGLVAASYGNASAVTGVSAGIRSGIFSAAGTSVSTTVLQGIYAGPAGNYDGIGVLGTFAPAASYGYGVVGQGNWFGVYANGDMGASGMKTFIIDHPLDPQNKYLRHFSMESDEVLNMYRGNVVLNAAGEATVQMPSYFQAINIDFSYNLTPIGAPANLYVKTEINAAGMFSIAGGNPGQKISWYVYAKRNDPYVQQNAVKTEAESFKKPDDKGLYLMPELYDQPKERGIFYRYKADPSKIPVDEMPATENKSTAKPITVEKQK